MKPPGTPPPPPRRRPGGSEADEPADDSGPSEDDEVYHLDLPLDSEADELEKERALRELMELTGESEFLTDDPTTEPADPAPEPRDDPQPADELLKAKIIREVEELATRRKPPTAEAPSHPEPGQELWAGEPADEELKAAAIREVEELAARHKKPPATKDDDIPVVDISDVEPADDELKAAAIRDVVELASRSQQPTDENSDEPVLEISAVGEPSDEDLKAAAVREVLELAARRKPPADDEIDEEPVLELSAEGDPADDELKAAVLRDVVELTGKGKTPMKAPVPVPGPAPVLTLTTTGESADDLEKAAVLQEVLELADRNTRAYALAKPMESFRSRPIVLAAIAIPALILGLYSFFARPEWVFGPEPGRMAPARRDAHLRFAMFLVAQRLYAFRDANQGQLPQSLVEIRENWPAIQYRALGSGMFELRAVADSTHAIVFRSDQDPMELFTNARDYLRERP